MRNVKLGLALISLAVCLVAPFLLFYSLIDAVTCKRILLAATAGWFVFATAWRIK
jgi:hypothetical protein